MKKQIPYYEQIVNQYYTGQITKDQLDKLCQEDIKLRNWVRQYEILTAAIEELKEQGKINSKF